MTPKEKAIELYKKYEKYFPEQYKTYQTHLKCIDCALITVNELIYFGNTELLSEIFEGDYYCDVDFFEAVKQEIEKI